MQFLVDTNIWLEVLLSQQRAEEVRQLFERCEGSEFAITDFSLHSIGIVLTGLGRDEAFAHFVADTFERAGTHLVRLESAEMNRLLAARKQFGLDFDDAYQYAAAEKYNLTLLSFDTDFDRTGRGRKTPATIGAPI